MFVPTTVTQTNTPESACGNVALRLRRAAAVVPWDIGEVGALVWLLQTRESHGLKYGPTCVRSFTNAFRYCWSKEYLL
jgi:hypothetical protein